MRADAVLDRHVRIHAVELVEIDVIDAEALQARVAGRADVLGPAVEAARRGVRRRRARCRTSSRARRGRGGPRIARPDQLLVGERAVHVGGVEQRRCRGRARGGSSRSTRPRRSGRRTRSCPCSRGRAPRPRADRDGAIPWGSPRWGLRGLPSRDRARRRAPCQRSSSGMLSAGKRRITRPAVTFTSTPRSRRAQRERRRRAPRRGAPGRPAGRGRARSTQRSGALGRERAKLREQARAEASAARARASRPRSRRSTAFAAAHASGLPA